MNLWDPKTIRQIMAMFGLGFRKEFGQNFLTDPMVIEDIADACSLTEDCSVLEIGPGIGVLTQALAQRYQTVKALEIDKSLIPVLKYTLGDYDNVTVYNEDVMQANLEEILAEDFAAHPVSVCANLPYYIISLPGTGTVLLSAGLLDPRCSQRSDSAASRLHLRDELHPRRKNPSRQTGNLMQ